MKKLCSLLLVLLCAGVFASAAFAGEMDYNGLLDPYSGLPLQTEDGKPSGEVIRVSDGVLYDRQRNLFLHNVDGQDVMSNVADGMITTTPVFIGVPTAFTAELYRNGEVVAEPDLGNITLPGSYVLDVHASQAASVQPLSFTIVSPVTGQINEYRMPDGFRVNALIFDGTETECSSSVVPMTEEGRYEVHYSCFKTQFSYSLNIAIDHTPPELTLTGVENGGRSQGKVTISDVERDSKIQIYLDGEPIQYSSELTKNGTYRILLEDEAGNVSTYDFFIPVYFNVNGVLLILLVIAIIAAAIAYPLYVRKHLRVR